jgi:2-aminoethylphosphonate-pyruvate transaminase
MIRCFNTLTKMFQKGPVQTSEAVKCALLTDYGSRDPNFGSQVEDLKARILRFAKLDDKEYSCVLMQGPPVYVTEALFGTINPPEKLLIVSNGLIGKEMDDIGKLLEIPVSMVETKSKLSPEAVLDHIEADTTHVAIVHEESTGLLNPINNICKAIKLKNSKITTLVNGSQAYDWIKLDFSNINYYISSFNNIIQAFSGVSFCIANKLSLNSTKGKYRSLSLDLQDQNQYQLDNPGQFRFTPPTHLIASAHAGIHEWEVEGINGRFIRLQRNRDSMAAKLSLLGFKFVIDPLDIGFSCVSVFPPKHFNWDLARFCASLKRKGFHMFDRHMDDKIVQFGFTGDISEVDISNLMDAVYDVLKEFRIPIPLKN